MEKTILILLATASAVLSNPVMTRKELLNQENRMKFCSKLVHLNNYSYVKSELKAIEGYPADMHVHWKTGNVFYTLINDGLQMSLHILRPSGEIEAIRTAGLGQTTTVDNLNDIVYLGTDNGVYKYKEDGSIELYTALGEDVMYLTVSGDGTVMYIATWPQNRVHRITNDGQRQETFPVIPNGSGLTIDTRNNIFFAATKTSYVLKNGQSIPIKIKGLPSEKIIGVSVSRSDQIFAMDEYSNLYSIEAENASANLLGSFNVTGANTFALDSADNILVGVKGSILKFNAIDHNPCERSEK